jgi:hypothetical protein
VLRFYARDRGFTLTPPQLPTPQGPAPLGDALLAMGALLGKPVPEDQLVAGAALPPELQQALALIVLAYVQATQDYTSALAGVTYQDLAALTRGEAPTVDVDGGKLASAGLLVDRAVREATPALRKWALLLAIEERTRHPALGDVAPETLLRAGAATQSLRDMANFGMAMQGWQPIEARFAPTSTAPSEALLKMYERLGVPVFPEDRLGFGLLDVQPLPKQQLMIVMADGVAAAAERLLLADQLSAPEDESAASSLVEALDWEALRGIEPAQFPARDLQPLLDALERADRALQLRLEAAAVLGDALTMAKLLSPDVAGLGGAQTESTQTIAIPELPPTTLPIPGLPCSVSFAHHQPVASCGVTGPVAAPPVKVNVDDGYLQVIVFADYNDNNVSEENERMLVSPPLADPLNDIILKDPWGFLLVGGEGSSQYDERYGSTNLSMKIENGTLIEERRLFKQGTTGGLFAPIFDNRDLNRTFFEPQENGFINLTMNPQNHSLLIVDLGGDDVYTNKPAGVNTSLMLYNSSVPERLARTDPTFADCFGPTQAFGPVGDVAESLFGGLLDGDGGGGGGGGQGIGGPFVFGVAYLGHCTGGSDPFATDNGVVIFVSGPNPQDPDSYGSSATYINTTNTTVNVRLAAILDTSGNEDYNWTGRDFALGAADRGVALLWDAERCDPGDQHPQCANFSPGNDDYRGKNNTTAVGWHRAVGLLLDEKGDDTHVSRNHSIGAGIERGVGLAVDLAGKDTYFGANYTMGFGGREELHQCGPEPDDNNPQYLCLFGGGSMAPLPLVFHDFFGSESPYGTTKAGFGLLLDRRGDDTYGQVNASSNQGKGWPALGVLLDLAGTDQGLQAPIATSSQLGAINVGLQDNTLLQFNHIVVSTTPGDMPGVYEVLAEGQGGGIVVDAEVGDTPAAPDAQSVQNNGISLSATEVEGPLPAIACPARDAGAIFGAADTPVQENVFGTTAGEGCLREDDGDWDWRAFSRQTMMIRVPGAFGLGGVLSNDGVEAPASIEEHLLHIDLDGNDLYQAPFAGAASPDVGALDTKGFDPGQGRPKSFVEYGPVLRPGVVAPVAITIDVGGADTYDARTGLLGHNNTTGLARRVPVQSPSLGGAYMGLGLLYDLGQAGNVTFPGLAARAIAPAFCAGPGVQDAYIGNNRTMGFGALFGLGALVDQEGDDCYDAESLPLRFVHDGITTSGSDVVRSASANFTVADIGHGLGGGSIAAGAMIKHVVNATTVILNKTAAASGTRVVLTIEAEQTRVANDARIIADFVNTTVPGFGPADVGQMIRGPGIPDGARIVELVDQEHGSVRISPPTPFLTEQVGQRITLERAASASLGAGRFAGVGVVLDARGNDTYRSGLQSQGSGILEPVNRRLPRGLPPSVAFHDCQSPCGDNAPETFPSFGAFVDGRGRDAYLAAEASAQGYGASLPSPSATPGRTPPVEVLAGLFVDDGFERDVYTDLVQDPPLLLPAMDHHDNAVWCSDPQEGAAVRRLGGVTPQTLVDAQTVVDTANATLQGVSPEAARIVVGVAEGTNKQATCLELSLVVNSASTASTTHVGSLGRGYDNLDFLANFALAAGTFGQEWARARSVLSAPAIVDLELCTGSDLACDAAERVASDDVQARARALWGPASLAYNSLQLLRAVCAKDTGLAQACQDLIGDSPLALCQHLGGGAACDSVPASVAGVPLRLNITGDALRSIPGQDATDFLNLSSLGINDTRLGNALRRVTFALRPPGAAPALDPCVAGQKGGEIPLGVFDRRDGPSCSSLEPTEAAVLGAVVVEDGNITLTWNTTELQRSEQQVRRRTPDGAYDLVARAAFQLDHGLGTLPADDERYVLNHLGDEYGFYPGLGMLRIAVDNAPVLYKLQYPDLSFDNDQDPSDDLAPNRELNLSLELAPRLLDADLPVGVAPEQNLSYTIEVVPLDAPGGLPAEVASCGAEATEILLPTTCDGAVGDAVHRASLGWQPGTFVLGDGQYQLHVTITEPAHGSFQARVAEACFYQHGGALAEAQWRDGKCIAPLWVDSVPPWTEALFDPARAMVPEFLGLESGSALVRIQFYDGKAFQPEGAPDGTLACAGNVVATMGMPSLAGDLDRIPGNALCASFEVDRHGVVERFSVGGTPTGGLATVTFTRDQGEDACAGDVVERFQLPMDLELDRIPAWGEARCLHAVAINVTGNGATNLDRTVALDAFSVGVHAVSRAASYGALRLEFLDGLLAERFGQRGCEGRVVGAVSVPRLYGDSLPGQDLARCARVTQYSAGGVVQRFDVGLVAVGEDEAPSSARIQFFPDPACDGAPRWNLSFPSALGDLAPERFGSDPDDLTLAGCMRAVMARGSVELLNRTLTDLQEFQLAEGDPAKIPLRIVQRDAGGSPIQGYQVRYQRRVLRDLPLDDPLPACVPVGTNCKGWEKVSDAGTPSDRLAIPVDLCPPGPNGVGFEAGLGCIEPIDGEPTRSAWPVHVNVEVRARDLANNVELFRWTTWEDVGLLDLDPPVAVLCASLRPQAAGDPDIPRRRTRDLSIPITWDPEAVGCSHDQEPFDNVGVEAVDIRYNVTNPLEAQFPANLTRVWTPPPAAQAAERALFDARARGLAGELTNNRSLHLMASARDFAGNVQDRLQSLAKVIYDTQGPAVELLNITTEHASLAMTWFAKDRESEGRIARSWVKWGLVDPATGLANFTYETNATQLGPTATALLPDPANTTALDGSAVPLRLTSSTLYALEAWSVDDVGNPSVLPVQRVLTDPPAHITIDSPRPGDTLVGPVRLVLNISGVRVDPLLHYNISLMEVVGNTTLTLPVENFTRRECLPPEGGCLTAENVTQAIRTFASARFPDSREAYLIVAVENALNPGRPVLVSVGPLKVDNTPPTTKLVVDAPGGPEWFRASALVRLVPEDAVSEIARIQYSLDNFTFVEYNASAPPIFDREGSFPIFFRSTDAAGNEELLQIRSVGVDRQRPEGSVLINGGAAATNDRNVTLTLQLLDTLAGLGNVTIDAGGPAEALEGPSRFAVPRDLPFRLPPGEGDHRVRVRALDRAGNLLELKAGIVLDTTPPTIEGVKVEDAGHTTATLSWRTSEPSGTRVDYGAQGAQVLTNRFEGGELGRSHVVVLQGLRPSQVYAFRVVAEDVLGNRATFAGTFETLPDVAAPGGVRDLAAQDLRNGVVRLAWGAAYDDVGIDHYVVYRGVAGQLEELARVAEDLFLDDTGLPGTSYDYAVRAIDLAGHEGPLSHAVRARATTRPHLLEAKVTPDRGAADQLFTYSVVVRDEDGDAPLAVRVRIGDRAFELQPQFEGRADFARGVLYQLSLKLPPTTLTSGFPTYQFEADDGAGSVRAPELPAAGPAVLGANALLPGLSGARGILGLPGLGLLGLVAAVVAAVLLVRRRRSGP